jgi:hypothetical protein
MRRSVLFSASAALSSLLAGSSLSAAVFVSQVVDYVPGAISPAYTTAAAALGPATLIHSYGVVSPFNPAFDPADIVGIGKGGRLTVRFPQPIADVPGLDFGVFNNVGLIDASYPSGTATNPAATFNALPRIADVSVSSDGVNYLPVSRTTFSNPANAFVNSGPFDMTAPSPAVTSDFGKSFTGTLASFDGLTWSQIQAVLDGSGGGTWLDVSGTGLSSFQYVRFEIPADGIAGSDDRLFIDAVSANNVAVPEPAMLSLAVLGGLALRRRVR